MCILKFIYIYIHTVEISGSIEMTLLEISHLELENMRNDQQEHGDHMVVGRWPLWIANHGDNKIFDLHDKV